MTGVPADLKNRISDFFLLYFFLSAMACIMAGGGI